MRARRCLAITAAAVGWIVATAAPALADTCIRERYFEVDIIVGETVGVTVEPLAGTGHVDGTVDFGNGAVVPISAGGQADVVYDEPGTYPITFTGQGSLDGEPCSDTAKPVGVYTAHELVAAFTADPGDDLLVSFDASSSRGPIEMYVWDFGDGSYGDGVSAQHEYAAPGMYQVTLSVMGMLGTDDATASLSLGDVTVLDFGDVATLSEQPVEPSPVIDPPQAEQPEEDEERDPRELLLRLAALVTGVAAALRKFYETGFRQSLTENLDMAAAVIATAAIGVALIALIGSFVATPAFGAAVGAIAAGLLAIAGIVAVASAAIKGVTGIGASTVEAGGAYTASELAEALGDPALAEEYRAEFEAAASNVGSPEYLADLQSIVALSAGGAVGAAWKGFKPGLQNMHEMAPLVGTGLSALAEQLVKLAGDPSVLDAATGSEQGGADG